jgi:hypothetical protein
VELKIVLAMHCSVGYPSSLALTVWCPNPLLLLSLLLLQALQLAQAALEGSDTDRLRSVSLGLLGRCHHALGDLAAAQHHYAQVMLNAQFPSPASLVVAS